MTLKMREQVQRRMAGLRTNRQPYESEFKEIASLAAPARSRWLSGDQNKAKRQRNSKMYNSHGIFAFRTLQGGMTSGLSSASRPWMTLMTYDEELMHDPEVSLYLSEVEKRMYAFFAQTNFYGAVKTGYLEMGMFGTEACLMVEHPTEGAVCHQLTAGEYWIGLGASLTPEALYRDCPMTVIQAVETFGKSRLSRRVQEAYDQSRYDEVVNLKHAIEKNMEMVPGRLDWAGKPWRSVYWDEADQGVDGGVISVSGYEEQPFWAPRWDTTGGDAWGQGPGHDALPDLRELQLQTKRKAEATDQVVWPELLSSSKVKLRRQPKNVVSIAAADLQQTQTAAPYVPPYQAIPLIGDDIQKCAMAIDRATYADLFMAITNMQGIQPRNIEEVAARNEEKLTQLGPVIERVNNEKLEVAIERAYGMMSRQGLLPPPPEALDGVELRIEFVSILTQMQRMVGLGQIERTMSFVGSMAPLYPEVRHKVDIFAAVDDYARRAGMPAKIIRTNEDAQAMLDAEQQAAQQAQMAEQAASMAPAVRDLAEAGRVAAEVPQSGQSAVDQLMAPLPL